MIRTHDGTAQEPGSDGKPLDSTEFVAQLAQFGTVSGVQKMQTSLTNLTDSMRSAQALQGTSLVGHDVLTRQPLPPCRLAVRCAVRSMCPSGRPRYSWS